MLKQISVLACVALSFTLISCEEEPLPIITEAGVAPLVDTTYLNPSPASKQDKVVLFEDFSGVRCPTCPNGHQALESLITNFPGRVAAVTIHAGQKEFVQAAPFKDAGQQDLNTSWGTAIFTIINKPNGIPYGIVDRVAGANITTQWESLATQRMGLSTDANAEVSVISYNDATRELRYEVKFEMTSDLNEALFFSTVITESEIVGKQEYTQGEYEDYDHNHILRDMPQFSENLNPGNDPAAATGRVFIKQYSYILPDLWVVEHCHLVAYIHKAVDVIQAAEVKIK